MKLSRILTVLAAASVASFGHWSVAQAEQLKVVSSFSIIGDLVKNVGGEHVVVSNLAGHDVDLHHFEPKPSDVKKLTPAEGAKLLFINGLELEPWAERLKQSSGFKGETVVVSEGIKPLKFDDIHHDHEHDHDHDHEHEHDHKHDHEHEHDHKHDHEHDHDHAHEDDHHHEHEHDHHEHDGHNHGEWDPHAWQNPQNAVIYVDNILNALKKADPANATSYEANAEQYLAQIKQLDAEIKKAFAALTKEQRRFGTNHEAFAYFAEAYDLTQIPVTGVSGGEPSAAQVAAVSKRLKQEGVRAVFFENTTNNRLIEQVAHDAGVKVGGTLVADALEKEGEGASYLGMIKKNADTLLDALK